MAGGEDIHPPVDSESARVVVLSERQIDSIAERVEARFYMRVGKKVVEKVLWLLGIVIVGLALFLVGKGEIPK